MAGGGSSKRFLFCIYLIMITSGKIHIENPCGENWQNMTPDKNGRFCNSCNKVVVDFSNKSLNEIQNYLSSSPVCGRYSLRHTSSAGKLELFLNRFENTLSKCRMQKIALFFITIILFLSGCHRRLQGYVSDIHNYRDGGHSSSISSDSSKTESKTPVKK